LHFTVSDIQEESSPQQ